MYTTTVRRVDARSSGGRAACNPVRLVYAVDLKNKAPELARNRFASILTEMLREMNALIDTRPAERLAFVSLKTWATSACGMERFVGGACIAEGRSV